MHWKKYILETPGARTGGMRTNLWWHYKRADSTPERRFRVRVAAFQAITAFLGRVKERGWGEVPPGVYLTKLGTCLAVI